MPLARRLAASRPAIVLVAAVLLVAGARPVQADFWNGFFSSDWSLGLNWDDLNGPPGTAEDAVFPSGGGIPVPRTTVQLNASTTIRLLAVNSPLNAQYVLTGSNGAVLTATAAMEFFNSDRQALNVHTVSSLGLNTPEIEVFQNAVLALNNATVTTDEIVTREDGRIDVNSGSSVQTNTYAFDSADGGELRVNSGGELRIFGDTTLFRGLTRVNSGGQLNAEPTVDLEYNGLARLEFADSHAVDDGVHLKATGGGDITAGSFIDVGNAAVGSLTVSGFGSTLTSQSNLSDWGAGSNGNATVTVSNSGVATVSALRAGTGGAVFQGNVTSGATLRTTSTFRMGGSSTVRTVSLSVGGGTLQTDGLATFDNLADLNLTSGTVNFNGGATFNAGSRFDWSGGVANLGAGQTLLVDGGATVNRTVTSGFIFSNNTTTRLRNGGSFVTPSYFDHGNATIDLSSGFLTVGTVGGTVSDWGAGATTTATIANNSLAFYKSGLRMSSTSGTTSATVSSGAQLVANGFLIAGGGSTSSVTLNATGGQVKSDGPISFLRGTTTTISSGGVVEGQDVVLGSSGGTATTTVTGANSRLRARSALTVGDAGTGQLNADSTGFVSAGGGVTIGSQGTVSLTTGSSLETGVGQSVFNNGNLDAISGSEIRSAVVNAGRLTVVGSSATRGVTLQSGSSSTVDNATFSSLTQQAGADIDFQLRGASDFDNLTVTGAASLAGDFVVSLGIGTTLTAGMTFPIFTAGSISGTPTFDFSAATLPSGLGWGTFIGPTSLSLFVVSVPVLDGDYNNDNIVDAADYTTWRDNVGTNTVLPNDPTGGVIGAAQYNTWRNNFGQSGNMTALAAATSVPEPASVVLLLVLFAAVRCIGPRITRQIENERKPKCPR